MSNAHKSLFLQKKKKNQLRTKNVFSNQNLYYIYILKLLAVIK